MGSHSMWIRVIYTYWGHLGIHGSSDSVMDHFIQAVSHMSASGAPTVCYIEKSEYRRVNMSDGVSQHVDTSNLHLALEFFIIHILYINSFEIKKIITENFYINRINVKYIFFSCYHAHFPNIFFGIGTLQHGIFKNTLVVHNMSG